MLDDAGVLILHGPARHPRFYGPLERQNREYRVWLPLDRKLPAESLALTYQRMIASLNGRLPREEAWMRRQRSKSIGGN